MFHQNVDTPDLDLYLDEKKEKLDLFYKLISDQDMSVIIKYLKNRPSIKKLNVDYRKLLGKSIEKLLALHIFCAIEVNFKLPLPKQNCINEICDLDDFLNEDKNGLNLSDKKLTVQDIQTISKYLTHRPEIKKLKVHNEACLHKELLQMLLAIHKHGNVEVDFNRSFDTHWDFCKTLISDLKVSNGIDKIHPVKLANTARKMGIQASVSSLFEQTSFFIEKGNDLDKSGLKSGKYSKVEREQILKTMPSRHKN